MKKLTLVIIVTISIFTVESISGAITIQDSTYEAAQFWEKFNSTYKNYFNATKGSIEYEKYVKELISLLNQRIKIEPSNMILYNNLISLLISIDKFHEAFRIIDDLLIIKADFIPGLQIQGLLLEKMGDTIRAKEKYQTALKFLESRLSGNNPDLIEILQNITLTQYLLHDKDYAISKLDSLIQKYKLEESDFIEFKTIIIENNKEDLFLQ